MKWEGASETAHQQTNAIEARDGDQKRTIAKLVRAHVKELIRLPAVLLGVRCSALDLLDVELLDALLGRDVGDGADESAVDAAFGERSNPVSVHKANEEGRKAARGQRRSASTLRSPESLTRKAPSSDPSST